MGRKDSNPTNKQTKTAEKGLTIVYAFAAYMYMDLGTNEDADLPAEIKEKYTLTKTLGR